MSLEDFVYLFYAQNTDDAQYYKTMLEDYDIVVENDDDVQDTQDNDTSGIVILVASDQLEEAEHIIEQQEALDNELEHSFANLSGDEKDDKGNDYDNYDDFNIENPDRNVDLDEFDDPDEDEEVF